MHNCRETKEQITELVLDGAERPDELLLAELRGCAECRAEFEALNATLRITTRLRETCAPPESYWSGYHTRLRQRVEDLAGEFHAKAPRRKGESRSFFAALRLCVRATVPVPVPLVVAVILVCTALGLFAVRARQPQSPLIVHVPVEVPVVQEKIVTQVVYRERQPPPRTSKRVIDAPKVNSTLAKSRKPQNAESPASLSGFKPSEEVKLVVIKGGYRNEK